MVPALSRSPAASAAIGATVESIRKISIGTGEYGFALRGVFGYVASWSAIASGSQNLR